MDKSLQNKEMIFSGDKGQVYTTEEVLDLTSRAYGVDFLGFWSCPSCEKLNTLDRDGEKTSCSCGWDGEIL